MEWGPHLKGLLKAEEQGIHVPTLDTMPELDDLLAQYWDAFTTLDSAREWGQGFPQPIRLIEIEAYARMKQYARSELDVLIRYVQYLDREYLSRQAERKKARAGTHSSH